MGEFFKPWRRKIGVVALVMALVFMAAWIRCLYYEDWTTVRIGDSFYLLRSDRGGFSCNRFDGLPPKGVHCMDHGQFYASRY